MEFVIGAGTFLIGMVVGFGLRGYDNSDRVESLESEMDSLREEFAPLVVQRLEGIDEQICTLSNNDQALVEACQSVAGRLAAWVTESQAKE